MSDDAAHRSLADIQSYWRNAERTMRLSDLEKQAVADVKALANDITLLVAALESEQQDGTLMRDQWRRLRRAVKLAVMAWKNYVPGDPIALLQLHNTMNALENLTEGHGERQGTNQVP